MKAPGITSTEFQRLYPHAFAELVMLQSLVRGWLARRKVRELRARKLLTTYNTRQLAAVRIQAVTRGHQIRRTQPLMDTEVVEPEPPTPHEWNKTIYQKLHFVSLRIQKVWRGHRDRQYVRAIRRARAEEEELFKAWELQQKFAVAKIQRVWRGFLGRRRAVKLLSERYQEILHKPGRAATRIQRVWRGHQTRTQLAPLKAAYHAERRKLEAISALKIQRVFRGFRGRKRARAKRRGIQAKYDAFYGAAATTISRVWRGYHDRKLYPERLRVWQQHYSVRCVVATCTLQRAFRVYLARKHAAMKTIEVAIARIKYVHNAARTIQCAYRRFVAIHRTEALRRHRAARTIQRHYRGYRTRVWFHGEHAVMDFERKYEGRVLKCQAVARGFLARRAANRLRRSRLKQLEAVRAFVLSHIRLLESILRQGYEDKAVVWHQSHEAVLRQYLAQQDFFEAEHRARMLIQATEMNDREDLMEAANWWHRFEDLALRIQRAWRGFVARRTIIRWHAAAADIQKCVRGRLARNKLERKRKDRAMIRAQQSSFGAVVALQSWWRGHFQRHMAKTFEIAFILQRMGRGYMARRALLTALTPQLLPADQAAIMLQKTWRGYHDRKQLKEEPVDRTTKRRRAVPPAVPHRGSRAESERRGSSGGGGSRGGSAGDEKSRRFSVSYVQSAAASQAKRASIIRRLSTAGNLKLEPLIGFTVHQVNPQAPVLIRDVAAGGPAQTAGLKDGDELVALADAPILGVLDFCSVIRKAASSVGSSLKVTYRRQQYHANRTTTGGKPMDTKDPVAAVLVAARVRKEPPEALPSIPNGVALAPLLHDKHMTTLLCAHAMHALEFDVSGLIAFDDFKRLVIQWLSEVLPWVAEQIVKDEINLRNIFDAASDGWSGYLAELDLPVAIQQLLRAAVTNVRKRSVAADGSKPLTSARRDSASPNRNRRPSSHTRAVTPRKLSASSSPRMDSPSPSNTKNGASRKARSDPKEGQWQGFWGDRNLTDHEKREVAVLLNCAPKLKPFATSTSASAAVSSISALLAGGPNATSTLSSTSPLALSTINPTIHGSTTPLPILNGAPVGDKLFSPSSLAWMDQNGTSFTAAGMGKSPAAGQGYSPQARLPPMPGAPNVYGQHLRY